MPNADPCFSSGPKIVNEGYISGQAPYAQSPAVPKRCLELLRLSNVATGKTRFIGLSPLR